MGHRVLKLLMARKEVQKFCLHKQQDLIIGYFQASVSTHLASLVSLRFSFLISSIRFIRWNARHDSGRPLLALSSSNASNCQSSIFFSTTTSCSMGGVEERVGRRGMCKCVELDSLQVPQENTAGRKGRQ